MWQQERKQVALLAAQHVMPTLFLDSTSVQAGALASYGPDIQDGFRQVAVYAGRILKAENPADLPVIQPTKFELMFNLKTAKELGLQIPPNLLAIVDEVIKMKRREFIAGLAGTAAWLVAAWVQKRAVPVIGFLSVSREPGEPHQMAAFRQGLSKRGYVDGRNLEILYRWAEDRDRRAKLRCTRE